MSPSILILPLDSSTNASVLDTAAHRHLAYAEFRGNGKKSIDAAGTLPRFEKSYAWGILIFTIKKVGRDYPSHFRFLPQVAEAQDWAEQT